MVKCNPRGSHGNWEKWPGKWPENGVSGIFSGTKVRTGDFAPLGNEFCTPEFWTRILGSNFLTLFFAQQKSPAEKFTLEKFTSQNSPSSGKKKAHKHKLFGPVALGTPRECPRDKPGLSPGQSGFVPGTNPGFLLILHSGSPVCPWDKPSLSLGHSGDEGRQTEFMC